MLILSRRTGQRVRLGDSIVVAIVQVSGDRVRLGIEAPGGMLVLREELDASPRSLESQPEPSPEAGLSADAA